MINQIKTQIQASIQVKQSFPEELLTNIASAAELMVGCITSGGKIAFCGNGGSAADAQHLTAELVGRFKLERNAWPAIAFNSNTSIITAIGNDYSFDDIFLRQVEGLLSAGDILVGISTSGNSANVVNAFVKAKENQVKTIGLTGCDGGQMASCSDLLLTVPSSDTPRIQESHIMIGHILCDLMETEIVSQESKEV